MPTYEIEKRLTTILAWGALVVTLLVTDRISVDPANIGKMVALATTAGFCLAILFSFKVQLNKYFKLPALLLFGFLLVCLISILLSRSPWEKGFFGTFGRNTGFLTYLSFAILFLASTQLYRAESYLRIIRVLLIAGIFNLIYCLIAISGFDLFTWENPYGKVLGTFGNPNFISSFMGIFITALFALILSNQPNAILKVLASLIIIASFIVINESDSQQGAVVAAGGIAIVGYFYLREKFKTWIVSFIYSLLIFAMGFVAVLGMLQIGPLSGQLYKQSVSFRGEYWQAGINMALGNPAFGVGIDSYGTFYRAYRSESATRVPGMNTVSDAAHNIFLDVLSGAGFLGFFLYIALILVVLFESARFVKVNRNFDLIFVTLFSTWIAYLAQSVISINQIGIALWGWILGGLLLGYSRKCNLGISKVEFGNSLILKRHKKTINPKEVPAGIVLTTFIGGVVFFLVSIPSLYADAVLRNAMSSGSAEKLYLAAKQFPLDANRINYVAAKVSQNGINEKSVELIKIGLKKFPNDFGLLYSQLQLTPPASEEYNAIGKRLHLADPFNPAYFKFK